MNLGHLSVCLFLGLFSLPPAVLAQSSSVISTETAPQLLERGLAHIRLGNLEKAIATFRAAIQKNPNLTAAHYNLGLGLAQIGKPKEAINAFYRSIQLKPDFAIAYSNIAAASLEINDTKTAITYSKRAIELAPNLAVAYYNLGLSLKQQKDLRGAIIQLQKSASLDPKSPETAYNLGLLIQETGDLNQAKTFFLQALTLNPKYAEANYNLGAVLLIEAKTQPELSEVITYFRQAIELQKAQKKDYANAYYGLGVAFAKLGKKPEAIQAFIRAQALFNLQKNSQWAQNSEIQIKNLRS